MIVRWTDAAGEGQNRASAVIQLSLDRRGCHKTDAASLGRSVPSQAPVILQGGVGIDSTTPHTIIWLEGLGECQYQVAHQHLAGRVEGVPVLGSSPTFGWEGLGSASTR